MPKKNKTIIKNLINTKNTKSRGIKIRKIESTEEHNHEIDQKQEQDQELKLPPSIAETKRNSLSELTPLTLPPVHTTPSNHFQMENTESDKIRIFNIKYPNCTHSFLLAIGQESYAKLESYFESTLGGEEKIDYRLAMGSCKIFSQHVDSAIAKKTKDETLSAKEQYEFDFFIDLLQCQVPSTYLKIRFLCEEFFSVNLGGQKNRGMRPRIKHHHLIRSLIAILLRTSLKTEDKLKIMDFLDNPYLQEQCILLSALFYCQKLNAEWINTLLTKSRIELLFIYRITSKIYLHAESAREETWNDAQINLFRLLDGHDNVFNILFHHSWESLQRISTQLTTLIGQLFAHQQNFYLTYMDLHIVLQNKNPEQNFFPSLYLDKPSKQQIDALIDCLPELGDKTFCSHIEYFENNFNTEDGRYKKEVLLQETKIFCRALKAIKDNQRPPTPQEHQKLHFGWMLWNLRVFNEYLILLFFTIGTKKDVNVESKTHLVPLTHEFDFDNQSGLVLKILCLLQPFFVNKELGSALVRFLHPDHLEGQYTLFHLLYLENKLSEKNIKIILTKDKDVLLNVYQTRNIKYLFDTIEIKEHINPTEIKSVLVNNPNCLTYAGQRSETTSSSLICNSSACG